MSANTAIEWATHTFNTHWGCQKVSEGCDHCYAETFAKRVGQDVWGPPATTQRRLFGAKHWAEPLAWDREAEKAGERHRVFCASMGDVFEAHGAVDTLRPQLWDLIQRTPHLDWLLLTKRPERLAKHVPWGTTGEPWPNVWLGTSVETQEWADKRIPRLLEVPAVVHWLSCEPLLGPVDLERYLRPRTETTFPVNAFGAARIWNIPAVSWVIAGGESGPRYRPMDLEWARSLRDQCEAAGVAYLFKQVGGRFHSEGGRLLDGREWNEYPTPRLAVAP